MAGLDIPHIKRHDHKQIHKASGTDKGVSFGDFKSSFENRIVLAQFRNISELQSAAARVAVEWPATLARTAFDALKVDAVRKFEIPVPIRHVRFK